jgi:hypothetical protein
MGEVSNTPGKAGPTVEIGLTGLTAAAGLAADAGLSTDATAPLPEDKEDASELARFNSPDVMARVSVPEPGAGVSVAFDRGTKKIISRMTGARKEGDNKLIPAGTRRSSRLSTVRRTRGCIDMIEYLHRP